MPPIWETAYISEVNRARKVKSDVQVAMNEISDPHAEICFLRSGWGDRAMAKVVMAVSLFLIKYSK